MQISNDLLKSALGSLGPDLMDSNLKSKIEPLLRALYGHTVSVYQYSSNTDTTSVSISDPVKFADFLSKFVYAGKPVVYFDYDKAAEAMEKIQTSEPSNYRMILEQNHFFVVLADRDLAMKLKLSIE